MQQDNLEYAVLAEAVTNPNPEVLETDAHYLRTNFRYQGGYRGFVAYETEDRAWEISATYTHIRTDTQTSTRADIDEAIDFLDDNFIFLPTTVPFTTSHEKWQAQINMGDIDFARNICVCDSVILTPHIGGRYLWMDQKLHINGSIGGKFNNNKVVSRFRERFYGYGVEGGLWLNWDIGCGLAIIGHVGGSILYSNFHVKSLIEEITTTRGFVAIDLLKTNNMIHSGTPTMDYFAGLEYHTCICGMNMGARAGYEQQIIFDANRIAATGGNLSLQGLTAGFFVEY